MIRVRVEGLDFLEEAMLRLEELRSRLREKGLVEENAIVLQVLGLLDAHKKELEKLKRVHKQALGHSPLLVGPSHHPLEV